MRILNRMKLEFAGIPENESFARITISAFAVRLNPTLDVLADVKTAVSEAVTNAIVHGYEGKGGIVTMEAVLREDGKLTVSVRDEGHGIEDIEKAMQPFYTTRPDQERSGMGFAVMKSFMDDVQVDSEPGVGTTVVMVKRLTEE